MHLTTNTYHFYNKYLCITHGYTFILFAFACFINVTHMHYTASV